MDILPNSLKRRHLSWAGSRQAGFTLVEIAVVLIIVGVLAGLGISAIGALRQTAGASNTVKKQETLKTALIAYLRNYRRLPCPDTDFTAPDGIENRTATTGTPPVPDVTRACSQDSGVVPYVTLGLPREAAVDGYDNLFSYFVSNAAPPALPEPQGIFRDWTLRFVPGTGGFTPGNAGHIQVDGDGGQHLTDVMRPETLAVVVIVSHGANGFGARTLKGTQNSTVDAGADEAANFGGSATVTFHQRTPTDNTAASGGAFDDVVLVLRPADLLSPLFAEGSMKPAAAQTHEQLNAIRDYAVSSAAQACTAPTLTTLQSAFPASQFYDGWGNQVVYVSGGSLTTASGASNSTLMFTLSATNRVDETLIGPSGSNAGQVLRGMYPMVGTACSS